MDNNISNSTIEAKVEQVAESREAGSHRLNRAILIIIAIILIFAFYVQMEIVRTYLSNSSKQDEKYSSKIGFLESMNKYFYDHLLGQSTDNKTEITSSDQTLTKEQLALQNKTIDSRITQLLQTGLTTSNTGITYKYNSSNNTITSTVTLEDLTTSNLQEGDNLYFTNQRVYSALNPQAPLSLSAGRLSIQEASASTNGYLSSEDFTTFNNKEGPLTFSNGLNRSENNVTNTLVSGKEGGQSVFGGTKANDTLTLDSTTDSARGGIFLNPNGGNVGIGTTNPQYTLDINGSFKAGAITGTTIHATTSIIFPDGTSQTTASTGGGSGTVNTGTAGYFGYYPSTGTAIDDQTVLYTNGTNIGVGMTSPVNKLSVSSNIGGSTATILVNNDSIASNAITSTEYRAGSGGGSYAAVGYVGGSASSGFGAQTEAFMITEGAGLNLISAQGGAGNNGIKFHVGTFPVVNNPDMVLDHNKRLGIGVGSSAPELRLDLGTDGGIIARGTHSSGDSITTTGAGSRLIWNPRRSAFRAGRVDTTNANGFTGDEWNDANVGQYSVAMGYNTAADGLYTFAMGYGAYASNGASIAMGFQAVSSGGSSVAIGSNINATGATSVALGGEVDATGDQSVAIGNRVTASATDAFVIGRGTGALSHLTNSTANSLMVGFLSTQPFLYVGLGPSIGDTGRVGINNANPSETFQVSGGSGENGYFRLDNLAPAAATQVCYDGSNRLSSCSSSQQFKENIKYLTNNDYKNFLQDILNTDVATFDYKTDHPGQQRLGIIAEEAPNFLQYKDQHGNTNIDFYSYQGGYTWAGIKALAMNMNDIKINIDPMATDISSLKDKVATLSSELNNIPDDTDASQIASFSASLASMSDRVELLTKELDLVKGQVLGAHVTDTLAQADSILSPDSTATLSALTVSGKTTLNDLGVTGLFTDGLITFDGINGTINTLSGPLSIQSLALGNVNLQGGKIEIDTKGNVTLKEGSLFIEKGIISGNASFVGNVIVPKGETTVAVTKAWNKKPGSIILTPSFDSKVWVTDVSATGFTVHVDQSADADRTVNWIAFWGE